MQNNFKDHLKTFLDEIAGNIVRNKCLITHILVEQEEP